MLCIVFMSCFYELYELYVPFNHMEYEETLNKARSKFCVYERKYGVNAKET